VRFHCSRNDRRITRGGLTLSFRSFHRSLLIPTLGAIFLIAGPASILPTSHAQNSVDPWSAAQTIQPNDLLKELVDTKTPVTVLYVGFKRLYTAGHIKGAQFHGSGGSADGLMQVKSWAATLPRSTNLVIYCGCCPLERCPNLRPAFTALREMGFTKLRALILPNSFAQDWADKGLPYEKSQ
jgi:thiosulfate/3-mercaptopyruvate sulfurtransferase